MTGFLRRHAVLVAAFAVALALVAFFALRIGNHARGWPGEEPLAPWMTVGYIGRNTGLDPREIDRIAGLPTPEEAGRPMTLDEIARDRGVPVEEIIRAVEHALRDMQHPEGGHGDGPDGDHGGDRDDGTGETATPAPAEGGSGDTTDGP